MENFNSFFLITKSSTLPQLLFPLVKNHPQVGSTLGSFSLSMHEYQGNPLGEGGQTMYPHLWLENTGPFMWFEVLTRDSDTISTNLLYPAHGSSLEIILNR